MTTMTQHAAGMFCWCQIGTTDPEAARKFYGPLFGWTWMRYGQQKDMLMVGITVLGLSGQAVVHTYRKHRI